MTAKKRAEVVRVCFVIEAMTDVRLVEGLAELGHLTLLIAVFENPAEAKRRAAAGRLLVRERFERTLVFEQLGSLVQTSVPRSAAV